MTREQRAVLVFDPTPVLTVTVELHGGEDDLHLHAGGQGVWVARMIRELGTPVTVCTALGGETGAVVRRLLELEGLPVTCVSTAGATIAYVHDRRGDERTPLAEMPARPLSRHEMDELYESALVGALDAGVCVLAGPRGDAALPAESYGRLAHDVRTNGGLVVADLDGAALEAVLGAGVDVLKVSDEQLVADGIAHSGAEDDVVAAMHVLRERGVGVVVVSRGGEPTFALLERGEVRVDAPRVWPLDPHGGGDSTTAGLAAALAQGRSVEDALRLGVAAATLNVTRRGLGTGSRERIDRVLAMTGVRER